MVQIEVGPSKETFQMHKKLLCSVAAYFRAALEGNFKEVNPTITIIGSYRLN